MNAEPLPGFNIFFLINESTAMRRSSTSKSSSTAWAKLSKSPELPFHYTFSNALACGIASSQCLNATILRSIYIFKTSTNDMIFSTKYLIFIDCQIKKSSLVKIDFA